MRNEIGDRLVKYAARVIRTVDKIPSNTSARKLIDQLVRSATSVGANYEEAQAAESRRDFIHKIQVALKESRESHYWLRVLSEIQIKEISIAPLVDEARQIRAILSKSVATAKGTSKTQK